jgi:hypothetical protein
MADNGIEIANRAAIENLDLVSVARPEAPIED